MKIHYIQHVPFENPGSILVWAAQRGHEVSRTLVYAGEKLPRPENVDWLVVMGGPMNIYEDALYPWLVEEKSFIKESIGCGKVVLGLCLGAQLIADAIGGTVTKNFVKEIGWHTVTMTDDARASSLFSFLGGESVVFQWHGDTFSVLPSGATVLAKSGVCAHQAFVYKKRVFGFQFHLECTQEGIEGLVANGADELVPSDNVQTAGEILAHPEYITQDNEWMGTLLSNLERQWMVGSI
jgi:GMP synthase-like glutamine amidotransferase